MREPTLFDSEYDIAVRDMIEQFRSQLSSASTAFERDAIRMAIRDWKTALEPVNGSDKRNCRTKYRKA